MLDVLLFKMSWRDLDVSETLEREMQNRRSVTGLQWSCVELVSAAASLTGIVSPHGIAR